MSVFFLITHFCYKHLYIYTISLFKFYPLEGVTFPNVQNNDIESVDPQIVYVSI